MLSMGDPGAIPSGVGMLGPFDPSLYEQPKPRFIFKMPRVVPDQKQKFETDDLFRRLSRESEVRYTGYRDRPQEERQQRFQDGCRNGHTEIAFTATGTNLQLMFTGSSNGYLHHHHHHHHHQMHNMSSNSGSSSSRDVDFDKEPGKVHLRSHFIMNGVCVCWRGWVDLERLDGVGCLEFDGERAAMEDAVLREQIERYNHRLREYEEKHRPLYRAGHLERGSGGGSSGAQSASSAAGNLGQPVEFLNNG